MAASTTPVGSTWWRRCHFFTEAAVSGPYSPSGVACTFCWIVSTAGPTAPTPSVAQVGDRFTGAPESVILAKLIEAGYTLAVAETFTGGNIAARIAPLLGAEKVFKRGVVTRNGQVPAEALRKEADASLALSVGLQLDEGPDRPDFGATISIGIANAQGSVARQARLVGGRDWVRVGAAELGLDCLRRHLLGLPVDERIDFERR